MVYASLMEFDVDLDTHIKIGETLGDAPVKGLILHAGGPSENGVHSLDVWETKEDSERFFAEPTMPANSTATAPSSVPWRLSDQPVDTPPLRR